MFIRRTSTAVAVGLLGAVVAAASAQKPRPPEDEINLRRTAVVEAVRRTRDAVVNISATKMVARRTGPFGLDPFWHFFDRGEMVRVPSDSLGSGFVIHPEGYIATNHHVIDRARAVKVEFADGRTMPAELIASDAEADLAILKVNPDKPLPALELGDSSDLMIGEPVIAVGDPLGYGHTVSTGIVSAIRRELRDSNDRVILTDLIQTDAAINPGNSGGPLLNAYGQVVGINTAIRGDAQNIGFAIQVNRLRDLIPELMNPLQVRRLDIPLSLRERRTLSPPCRVHCEVIEANNNSRVVTAINGRRIANLVDAYVALLAVQPEDRSVTVRYADGTERRVPVRPAAPPSAVTEGRRRLGLTIEQLTPMLAERYRLSVEEGLFVSEVARDGPAARAGIRAGDVIIQLGRYRVSTLEGFDRIMHSLPEHGRMRVGVVRGDRMGYTTVDF